VIIRGIISRTTDAGRNVDIPFMIDSSTGTYNQWGHDTMTLGENVDLLESIRDAMIDAD